MRLNVFLFYPCFCMITKICFIFATSSPKTELALIVECFEQVVPVWAFLWRI